MGVEDNEDCSKHKTDENSCWLLPKILPICFGIPSRCCCECPCGSDSEVQHGQYGGSSNEASGDEKCITPQAKSHMFSCQRWCHNSGSTSGPTQWIQERTEVMAKLRTWPSAREPDGCSLTLTQALLCQDEPSPSAGSKLPIIWRHGYWCERQVPQGAHHMALVRAMATSCSTQCRPNGLEPHEGFIHCVLSPSSTT